MYLEVKVEERKFPSSNRSSVAGDDWIFESKGKYPSSNRSSVVGDDDIFEDLEESRRNHNSSLSKTMRKLLLQRCTEWKSKEEPTEKLAELEATLKATDDD